MVSCFTFNQYTWSVSKTSSSGLLPPYHDIPLIPFRKISKAFWLVTCYFLYPLVNFSTKGLSPPSCLSLPLLSWLGSFFPLNSHFSFFPNINTEFYILSPSVLPYTARYSLRWNSEKPSRLQSTGSHRVGHDWSDLASKYIFYLINHPPTYSGCQRSNSEIHRQFRMQLEINTVSSVRR